MFGKLKQYSGLYTATLMLFETSMGAWDLTIYDPYGDKKWIGQGFHVIFIILNLLMLLNLVIAIMSDTYGFFVDEKLGLYFSGVIEAMPVYKTDKRYGALISAIPPFNLIVTLLIPFFLGTTDENKLIKLNSAVCKMFYFPIAFITTIVFTAFNLALWPLATLYSLIHKAFIFINKPCCKSFCEFVGFLVFGLPLMFIAIFPDCWRFFIGCYDENI